MHIPVSGHYACIHKVAGEYAHKFDDFAVVIQPGFVDGTPEHVPINFLSDVRDFYFIILLCCYVCHSLTASIHQWQAIKQWPK